MGFLKGHKRGILIPILLLISIMAFFTVFGDKGLLRAYRLKKELQSIERENKKLEQENEKLREEIKRLDDKTYDPKYIEMLAREELGLVKKGEIVFEFDE
jgi:cell division protein FtsB